ncbi:hypothetical protein [Pseudomonas sp. NFX15]|uniref:hypothetical protein n=1 Tax=Pseudomonas sp. NFX15 TaxID=2816958 RepID=UPI003B8C47BE
MLNTLLNTPLWVYAIFLLLCYLGIRALMPSRESRLSMLITPPILLGWSLYSLNLTFPVLVIGYWTVTVVVSGVIALVIFSRKGVQLDDSATGLSLPGTAKTLALYLVFFAVNYYFGYQAELYPQKSATLPMVLLKAVASGAACGLICGRSIKFYLIYRTLKNTPV